MHAIRLIFLALMAFFPAVVQAGPLRCAEDAEGGACVWGRAEGYDGGWVQLRGLPIHVIGITAPSHKELCANKATKEEFDCGRPARKRMGELVAKGIACTIVDVTSDGLLGRCRVAEGDLARLLVASGVARAAKDGPLDAEQAAALAGRKGLWAAEIIPPKDWEAQRRKAERD